MPIRDSAGAVLYVIHDSTLIAYAESVSETTDNLTKTFGDLLAVAEFSQLVQAVGYIPTTASVADARTQMRASPTATTCS